MESIGIQAFLDCNELTDLTLPDSVKSIGQGAFSGCKSIKSINIPGGNATIPSDTFRGCLSLASVTLPASLRRIEDGAFYGCHLTEATYDGDADMWRTVSIGANNFALTETKKVFIDCALAKDDVVDDRLNDMNGLEGFNYTVYGGGAHIIDCKINDVTELIIPDGAIEINAEAFYKCKSLTTVCIPLSIKKIGKKAFPTGERFAVLYSGDESDWNMISIDPNNAPLKSAPKTYLNGEAPTAFAAMLGEFFYDKLDEGEIVITGAKNKKKTKLVIPEGVTEIADNAFAGHKHLTEVTVADSVRRIGKGAFSGCPKLTSVKLPEGLTAISDALFFECRMLSKIDIPKTVTAIGDQAFDTCTGLKCITLPEDTLSIGARGFKNCIGIKDILLPKGLTSIGDQAFLWCRNLSKVKFDGGFTSIGDEAFRECEKLQTVTLPQSLTDIGRGAFVDCNALAGVFYRGTKKQWKKINIDKKQKGNKPLLKAKIIFEHKGE